MSDYWRLSSLYLMYFLVVGGMVPYWSLYLQHLGFDPAVMGTLLAVPMLTKILLPNIWGWLADVTGQPRRVMQLGILGACLAFVGVCWRQDVAGLLLCLIIYSTFWNAVLPQFEAITLANLGTNAHHYSRIRLWGSIGFVVAVLSLGWLFDRVSVVWLPPILLVCLVVLVVVSLWVPKPPARIASRSRMGLWPIVRQPRVYGFFLATAAFQVSYGVYYGFYSLFLQQHGYSHSQIGSLWMLGVLAEILLFWRLPQVLPRLNIEWCLISAMAIGALRWAGIALWVDFLWLLVLLQLLHALTFGLFHAASVEFIRRTFGAAQQSQGQALYVSLAYGLGGAIGVYVCGHLWASGPGWAFAFAVTLAALGALVAFNGFRK